MADQSDEQSWRPILLALAVLAGVGWLTAGFLWWQGGQTQSYLTEQLAAAERARASLSSDLQNLEKAAGAAADLTKQIGDARLAISGAQEEASARTRDLQAVDARFKDESDHVAALQSQDQSLSAEVTRLQGDADAGRKALADAQTQTASAQKEFEALQSQITAATAELNSLQEQIRAAKSATGSSPNP